MFSKYDSTVSPSRASEHFGEDGFSSKPPIIHLLTSLFSPKLAKSFTSKKTGLSRSRCTCGNVAQSLSEERCHKVYSIFYIWMSGIYVSLTSIYFPLLYIVVILSRCTLSPRGANNVCRFPRKATASDLFPVFFR